MSTVELMLSGAVAWLLVVVCLLEARIYKLEKRVRTGEMARNQTA